MTTRTRIAALSVSIAVAAPVAMAWAHSGVKSYSPRKNSTVPSAITQASVTFKGAVLAGRLTVRGPNGAASSGSGKLSSSKKVVTARLKRGLQAGRYTASWKAVHNDGHVTRGTWSFRLR